MKSVIGPLNKSPQTAFTLIELLVALVIVSIVITIATLMFANFGKNRAARMQLQQLTYAIHTAQQQAILQASILGLRITHQGYRFYQYRYVPNKKIYQWQALQNNLLSQPRAFPADTRIAIKLINQPDNKNNLIVITPNDTLSAFTLILNIKDQCIGKLIALSNGNIQQTSCDQDDA